MIELVGKPLSYAKAVLLALGKDYLVVENYKHQELKKPTLIVTNVTEKNGKIEIVVGEFFMGE